jgi:glycerol-3-phosphate cytidylyltransferase
MLNNDYIFIRHGQTYWNKNGIMHGQYDIPLNQTGRNQAKKISNELKNIRFDICFSSPLIRAKSTAIEILKNHRNVKIIYDERLKELYKGKLEGKHVNGEKLLKNEDKYILEKYNIESKKQFFTRVSELINDIESKYKNKRILIVAHSGTIKMCFFHFNYPKIPLHKAYYLIKIKNCIAYNINSINLNFKKMKIGFFPMVADILHSGHVIAIEEAKKNCDYLIIGLHCNPLYKNPQQSIYERFMQLRAVKWVDEIIPYQDINKDKNMFISLDYDVYFLGNDHKDNEWELRDEIQNLGREIVYINRNHEYSSSKIKNEAKSKL